MRDRTGVPSSVDDDSSNPSHVPSFPSNFFNETYGYDLQTSAPLLSNISTPAPPSAWYESLSRSAELDVTDAVGLGTNCGPIPNLTDYSYTRDPAGRTTGVHTTFSFGSNCGSPSTVPTDQTYAYLTGNDRVQKYAGPDGTRAYAYDARGLVRTLTVTPPGASQSETWTFDYDAAGRSAHVTYPDGHIRAQLYDSEGRLASRCYTYGGTSYCYTATYDPAGNPSTMTDPYGGTDSYAYDALNRVTQVTRQVAGTTEHVESYSYNALGAVHTTFDPVAGAALTLDDQRPKLSGGGTAPAAMVNTFNSQPVTLDGGGRVTAINGATLAYELFARVTGTTSTSATTTTSELFAYDAYLRRTERTHIETTPTTSTTTKEFYVYDGDNIVAKVDGTGAAKDIYLYDGIDHPLRLSRAGVSTFYEVDLAGNVRRLRDSSGNDLGGYRYTAFGQAFPADATTPAPAVNQPWQWKGRWFEPVAGGLYEMRARWWSPAVGAFLSVDEYAYHDRNSTLWGWPGQNPVRWRDPSGHLGAGVQLGGGVETGVPLAGLSAQGSGGVGVFWGGPGGLSAGAFAGGGALAGGALGGLGAPSSTGLIVGASAGLGVSAFVTNADSVSDLEGPFTQTTVTVGLGSFQFSIQVAWGGGTWFAGFGPPFLGASLGLSASTYDTYTVGAGGRCP